MQQVLKGLLWIVAGSCLFLVVAFMWGRLRPLTEAEAAAWTTIHTPAKSMQGRNAYPLQWFADFDVPYDQIDSLYAKDNERIVAWRASLGSSRAAASDAPAPHPPYPALTPLGEDKSLLCGTRDDDCLGKARAHPEALHTALLRHHVRLERDQALAHYDYAWNDVPSNLFATIPNYGGSMGLWSSAAALDFVEGRTQQGLESTCTQALTMRRLHAHSNTLIGTMIFAARLQGATRLFVQMLSELPPDQALPDSCALAFAPITSDDVDLCTVMREEFAGFLGADTLKLGREWYQNWQLSYAGMQRLAAPIYAMSCNEATLQQLLSDRRFTAQPMSPRADVFDWVSNWAGVTRLDISTLNFNVYYNRQQDTAAALRLVATVLWLRETQGDHLPVDIRLAQRPAWMQVSKDRSLSLSPDKSSLRMGDHSKYSSGPNSWPLPKGL
jgi:hypothetical protein